MMYLTFIPMNLVSILKDYAQLIFWIITAWVAISQLQANRTQRERELRFQQANAGKKLLEELFNDEEAIHALDMLDFDKHSFKNQLNEDTVINKNDIINVLKENLEEKIPEQDIKNVFIIKSFDALFYNLNYIEHFIKVGLTTEDDLIYPLDYFVKKMAQDKSVYTHYIKQTTYSKALDFLERFAYWRDSNT